MLDPKTPGIQDESQRLASSAMPTAASAGPPLDLRAGFAPGGVGQLTRAAVFVTYADLTNGAYAVRLQQSDDAATWADVTPAVAIGGTGWTTATGAYAKRYVRLAWAVSGSAPSIPFDAWLDAKVVSAGRAAR